MTAAKGGDPTAQAVLNDLLKTEYIQERTNLPTAINQQKQTFLMYAAEIFGPEFGRPFKTLATLDAIAWRGYQGFNYIRSIEAVKQGTDLSGLMVSSQPAPAESQNKQGWLNRNKQPRAEELRS